MRLSQELLGNGCNSHLYSVSPMALTPVTVCCVPQGASSDARVYLEMFGPFDGQSSGEIRLINADVHQRCFTRDALDCFVVSQCNPKECNGASFPGQQQYMYALQA